MGTVHQEVLLRKSYGGGGEAEQVSPVICAHCGLRQHLGGGKGRFSLAAKGVVCSQCTQKRSPSLQNRQLAGSLPRIILLTRKAVQRWGTKYSCPAVLGRGRLLPSHVFLFHSIYEEPIIGYRGCLLVIG